MQTVVFFSFSILIKCQSMEQNENFKKFEYIDENEAIVNVAADLITNFFIIQSSDLNFITSFESKASRYNTEDIVEEIIPELLLNVTILSDSSEDLWKNTHKKIYNLFFVDSYKSFMKIYVTMKESNFDHQGWYLIIFTIYRETQKIEMQKIFDDLWKIHVINVNIILKDKENHEKCEMFTYFPFAENYCEKVFPVLLNTFVSGKGFIEDVEPYPNKMANMYGCPINAVTFDIPPYVIVEEKDGGGVEVNGFEGILIKTMAEVMNFTITFNIQDDTFWGSIDEQGKSSGAISSVMKKEVNLTFGFFILSPLRNTFMSASEIYYTTNLVWVVAAGDPFNQFDRFFKPFNVSIWICLAFVFIVSVITICIIRCRSLKVRNFVFGTRIRNPIQNMVNVFLGGPMTKLPRRNFARTLLGLFLIYSFVVRNAYTGALFRFLQKDFRTVPVNDFSEMLGKNFSLFVLDFNTEKNSDFVKLPPRLMIINLKQYNDFIGFIRDDVERIALLASDDLVAYWNQKEFPDHFFHHLPQIITSANLCFYMHKTSCLKTEFNRHIQNFNSKGLIHKWKRIYRNKKFLYEKSYNKEPQKLKMDNLSGAFSFLIFGYVAAVISFALELFWRQIRHVHRRN